VPSASAELLSSFALSTQYSVVDFPGHGKWF
jgi:hypothetical protein